MRALSSGPRTMLGFRDMARLRLPFQPVGGGVPEESSCRPGRKLLKPVARVPGPLYHSSSPYWHALHNARVRVPFHDVLLARLLPAQQVLDAEQVRRPHRQVKITSYIAELC